MSKELLEAVDAIEVLQDNLGRVSDMIKAIENKLEKQNKFKLEFQYHACNIEGVFISWRRIYESKKKRCRLFLKIVEKDIDRPFCELPVQLRLDYVKYLGPFLIAFREFAEEKAKEVQKVIETMEDEWGF